MIELKHSPPVGLDDPPSWGTDRDPPATGDPALATPSIGGLSADCAADNLPAAFHDLNQLLDDIWSRPEASRAKAVDQLDDQIADLARLLCPDLVQRLRYLARQQKARRPTVPNRYYLQADLEAQLIVICEGVRRYRPKRYRDFQDLLNAIEKRRGKSYSLSEAAAFLSLSPSHLSKKFKAATGHGFVSYVTARRLRQARLMLAYTDWPVTKIAATLDFHQANYFARVFKADTGMSPSAYRQTWRSEH